MAIVLVTHSHHKMMPNVLVPHSRGGGVMKDLVVSLFPNSIENIMKGEALGKGEHGRDKRGRDPLDQAVRDVRQEGPKHPNFGKELRKNV